MLVEVRRKRKAGKGRMVVQRVVGRRRKVGIWKDGRSDDGKAEEGISATWCVERSEVEDGLRARRSHDQRDRERDERAAGLPAARYVYDRKALYRR